MFQKEKNRGFLFLDFEKLKVEILVICRKERNSDDNCHLFSVEILLFCGDIWMEGEIWCKILDIIWNTKKTIILHQESKYNLNVPPNGITLMC